MADLVLRIRLDDSGAVQTVREIKDESKEVQDGLDQAGTTGSASMRDLALAAGITTAALAATAGAAVALYNELKEVAQVQDDVAKQSRRLGIGVETLSAYRLAADLTGTSLETVGVAIRTVSRNALDAARGVGEGAEAFAILGIDVAEANGKLKDGDTLLLEIADRLALVDDTTAKLALSQKLFGRGGTELLTLLEQGSAGIQAMKERAEELGIVFDAETAAGSEAFNDALTELDFAIEGVKITIGNELIPLFRDLIPEITGVVLAVSRSVRNIIESDLGEFVIDTLRRRVEDSIILLRFLAEVAERPLEVLLTPLTAIAEISRITAETRGRLGEVNSELDRTDRVADPAAAGLDNIVERLRALGEEGKKTKTSLGGVNEEIREFTAAEARAAGFRVPSSTLGTFAGEPERPSIAGLTEGQRRAGVEALPTDEQIRQTELETGIRQPRGTPDISESLPKPDLSFETPELSEVDGAAEPIRRLTEDFQLLGDTLGAVGEAYEDFLLGQKRGAAELGQVVAQTLAGKSKAYLVESLSELAAGVAALTPWGAAIYGPAPPHFKSAALWGAAAAATGAGARGVSALAGGPGGAAGGGGAGFGGRPGGFERPVLSLSDLRQGVGPSAPDLGALPQDNTQTIARAVRDAVDQGFAGIRAVPAGEAAVLMIESAGGLSPLLTSSDRQELAGDLFNESRL